MKQLYLLPLSLILMTQGFANTLNNENANSFAVVQEDSLSELTSDELNIEQLVSFNDYDEFVSHQGQEDSEQEQSLLSDSEYDEEGYQPAPQPKTQRRQPQSTRQVPAQARTSQRRQPATAQPARKAAVSVEAEIQEDSNQPRKYSPQARPAAPKNKSAVPQRNLTQRQAPVEAAQPVEESAPSRAQRAPAKVNRTQQARPQSQRQTPSVSQKNSVEPTPSRQPARRAAPVEAQTPRKAPAQARTAQRQVLIEAETAQEDFTEPSYQRRQGRMQAQNNNYNMNHSSSQQMNNDQPTPSMDRSADKLPEAINMPARPVLEDSWDLWIMGEALLWQAAQENMEYVYKGTDGPGTFVGRNSKTPSFSWDWGWRLGIGFNTPYDGWDLALTWTHIENTARGHTHQGSESLFIVWSTANNAPTTSGTKASAHWKNHLNQIDFDLGREFYVGRHLTLRPNTGLRTTWINQHYHVNFNTATANQKDHMSNRFWGFGFFAGLDTDWMLGRGFSIYGDSGIAVLFGFFKVHQHGTQDGSNIFNLQKSQRAGRPVFDLDMGLKWHSKFYSDRFAATLKVGYEYHLYFDQNQLMQSNGNSDFELFNSVNGDLAYQGVTFSAQFDF